MSIKTNSIKKYVLIALLLLFINISVVAQYERLKTSNANIGPSHDFAFLGMQLSVLTDDSVFPYLRMETKGNIEGFDQLPSGIETVNFAQYEFSLQSNARMGVGMKAVDSETFDISLGFGPSLVSDLLKDSLYGTTNVVTSSIGLGADLIAVGQISAVTKVYMIGSLGYAVLPVYESYIAASTTGQSSSTLNWGVSVGFKISF